MFMRDPDKQIGFLLSWSPNKLLQYTKHPIFAPCVFSNLEYLEQLYVQGVLKVPDTARKS